MSHKFTECTQLCAHKHAQNQQSTKTSTRTHTNKHPQTLTNSHTLTIRLGLKSESDSQSESNSDSEMELTPTMKPLIVSRSRSSAAPKSFSPHVVRAARRTFFAPQTARPSRRTPRVPRHYSTHAQNQTLTQTTQPETSPTRKLYNRERENKFLVKVKTRRKPLPKPNHSAVQP